MYEWLIPKVSWGGDERFAKKMTLRFQGFRNLTGNSTCVAQRFMKQRYIFEEIASVQYRAEVTYQGSRVAGSV